MRDYDSLTFHPTSEKIVDILCRKTQNENPEFFRVSLCYYLAKITASMRVKIATQDRGEIPVNLYAINLATSGHGKGHSTNIIEEQLIHQYRDVFFNDTYPVIAEMNLNALAVKRAAVNNEDEEAMLEKVKTEFRNLGKLLFSFDSASGGPAIKQLRQKLLMGGIGSMNMEIDEVGNNLSNNLDALASYLELYDVGKIKQKLIKNSKENVRNEEIEGRTPANLLMYGTPSKLFDGAKVEDEFYSYLDTGAARRSIFGFSKSRKKKSKKTPKEIFDSLTDRSVDQYMQQMAVDLGQLANVTNYAKTILVDEPVSLLSIEYRLDCEERAEAMGEHEEIGRAEMSHRYFKAMKLAGVYAFIDGDTHISEDNMYHAICMIEESGRAFEKILSRDRTYVKLAKYLGAVGHEVTHVELTEDLPFYRGSSAAKQELIQLAAAWGYKNHTVIKRSMVNGIEFFRGESLKETELDKLQLSYSKDISDGYQNVTAPWDKMYKLTQQVGMHWVNHHSTTGHRSEDHMIPGFDMVVLDVDGTASIQEVRLLLKDFNYMLYTTKRHTNTNHRFRVIMPLNYHLKMSKDEYTQFIQNIYDWVPFEVDTGGKDRCRKWLTNKGNYSYSQGSQLLDARLFIPKTSKSDEQKQFIATFQSMTNMERWFLNGSVQGNRNNQLMRYAMLLVDLGYTQDNVRNHIMTMNDKLGDKLPIKEIDSTIMVSVARKIVKLAQP